MTCERFLLDRERSTTNLFRMPHGQIGSDKPLNNSVSLARELGTSCNLPALRNSIHVRTHLNARGFKRVC